MEEDLLHRPSARSRWIALGIFGLVVLVATLVVANCIAWIVKVRRARRIQHKTESLARHAEEKQVNASEEKSSLPTVPVTILTGFLGAGKTTLLNRILRMPQLPYRIMVLENEIGTISIDHSLLKPGSAADAAAEDGIYVLQNGCMCCTAQGMKAVNELERILDYLLKIVDEQGFDYVLVETTGLADPGPIIETFLQLRASRFRLDGIVTLVDAKHCQAFWCNELNVFEFPIELQRQLLYADIVALNKMDLVQEDEMKRLKDTIVALNEEAMLYSCTNAELSLTSILGVKTFDEIRFRKQVKQPQDAADQPEGEGQIIVSRGAHTGGVNTVHFEVDASVDLHAFGEWLNQVVAQYSKTHILRIKGVLALVDNPYRCVLQCVLDTYTVAPAEPWEPNEIRSTRLVLIGVRLDREELEEGFMGCVVPPSNVAFCESKKEV